MKHADLWRAIDRLASINGLSVSGLARRSGLDPTSFNKSKRHSAMGKPRWPNTESIAKVLAATNATLSDFTVLLDEESQEHPTQRFAVFALSAGRKGDPVSMSFDLRAAKSQENSVSQVKDPDAFALEIDSGAYAPIYRKGSIVIVSPDAERRAGDRVATALSTGQILLCRLSREAAESVVLQDLSADGKELAIAQSDFAWLARILWASQ